MFENHRVEAESVADFLERYYKQERYHGRGAEYAAGLLASHEKCFLEDGYDTISRHDSVTGEVVAYFGAIPMELWLYCFQCRSSHLHIWTGKKYQCPNCGMKRMGPPSGTVSKEATHESA